MLRTLQAPCAGGGLLAGVGGGLYSHYIGFVSPTELGFHMTVRENLLLGDYICPRRELSDRLARVYDWFPRLGERRQQPAGSLSGGEQQMVAIGRGLMAAPRLLLLVIRAAYLGL